MMTGRQSQVLNALIQTKNKPAFIHNFLSAKPISKVAAHKQDF